MIGFHKGSRTLLRPSKAQTIRTVEVRWRCKVKIIEIDTIPAEKRSGGIFVGTVEAKPLVNESTGASDLKLDIITFPPGVRNKPHRHTYDQVLYILAGEGIVATENEQKTVVPGVVAFIPRGELHWHGATETSSFQHISILRPGDTKY